MSFNFFDLAEKYRLGDSFDSPISFECSTVVDYDELASIIDTSNRQSPDFGVGVSTPNLIAAGGLKLANLSLLSSYLNAMIQEVQLLSTYIDRSRQLSYVSIYGQHAGVLDGDMLEKLLEVINVELQPAPDSITSIAVEASSLSLRKIDDLRRLGVGHIKIEAFDTRYEVLEVINQHKRAAALAEQVDYIKKRGRIAAEVELQFGLPMQAVEGFVETASSVVALEPDIITLTPSRGVASSNSAVRVGLPSVEEKLHMLFEGYGYLYAAGYTPISGGRFAKNTSQQAADAIKQKEQLPLYGVGSGAKSCFGGFVGKNKSELDYLAAINAGNFAAMSCHQPEVSQRLVLELSSLFRHCKLQKDSLLKNGSLQINSLQVGGMSIPKLISDLMSEGVLVEEDGLICIAKGYEPFAMLFECSW